MENFQKRGARATYFVAAFCFFALTPFVCGGCCFSEKKDPVVLKYGCPVVRVDYLTSKQCYFHKKIDGYLMIQITNSTVDSLGVIHNAEDDFVCIKESDIQMDPDLNIGGIIWIDGKIFRPLSKAPSITVK